MFIFHYTQVFFFSWKVTKKNKGNIGEKKKKYWD